MPTYHIGAHVPISHYAADGSGRSHLHSLELSLYLSRPDVTMLDFSAVEQAIGRCLAPYRDLRRREHRADRRGLFHAPGRDSGRVRPDARALRDRRDAASHVHHPARRAGRDLNFKNTTLDRGNGTP